MEAPKGDWLVKWIFRVWSGFYDLPVVQGPIYRRVHGGVLDEVEGLEGITRVIDVGCGTGLLTEDLAARYESENVVGVDMSPHMLRAGRKRMGDRGPALVVANAYALPFRDGAFDLVTSTLSYHWYLEPGRALREIHRVLAPGGWLVLATMATARFEGVVAGRARLVPAARTREDLETAGFRVERQKGAIPLVRIFVARKP